MHEHDGGDQMRAHKREVIDEYGWRHFGRRSAAGSTGVGEAIIQGRPGVLLSMSSQFGANTLEVTHAVEDALANLIPALQADGITVYPNMHRPANFIERALTNIQRSAPDWCRAAGP